MCFNMAMAMAMAMACFVCIPLNASLHNIADMFVLMHHYHIHTIQFHRPLCVCYVWLNTWWRHTVSLYGTSLLSTIPLDTLLPSNMMCSLYFFIITSFLFHYDFLINNIDMFSLQYMYPICYIGQYILHGITGVFTLLSTLSLSCLLHRYACLNIW